MDLLLRDLKERAWVAANEVGEVHGPRLLLCRPRDCDIVVVPAWIKIERKPRVFADGFRFSASFGKPPFRLHPVPVRASYLSRRELPCCRSIAIGAKFERKPQTPRAQDAAVAVGDTEVVFVPIDILFRSGSERGSEKTER